MAGESQPAYTVAAEKFKCATRDGTSVEFEACADGDVEITTHRDCDLCGGEASVVIDGAEVVRLMELLSAPAPEAKHDAFEAVAELEASRSPYTVGKP